MWRNATPGTGVSEAGLYILDFHKNAQKAAEAAHCAGEQGKFWEMHDRLFANQQNIAAADLPKHAEALQLDTSLFQKCLDSGRYAADIKKDIDVASSAGIVNSGANGTAPPTAVAQIVPSSRSSPRATPRAE